jgi:hypothetical protein
LQPSRIRYNKLYMASIPLLKIDDLDEFVKSR